MSGHEINRHWRIEAPQRTPAEAFALLADIESYPTFVPGFRTARIITRSADSWLVENVYALGPLHARFLTTARFDAARAIDITCRDAPWGSLALSWRFEPKGEGCSITCNSRIGFHSPLAAMLAGLGVATIERSVIDAFDRRLHSG